jgi:ABC-type lipoprotein export system ATPase subunit
VNAVDGINFEIDRGEIVGIVGESGSGKTMTALSLLRLIPEPGKITGGRILYGDKDVVQMTDEEIREFRGNEVAMIFQDPMTSLNPVLRVGFQIEEAMAAHARFTSHQARDRVVPMLQRVRIPAAKDRARDYPHQFSGGMRQRAMIAMGVSNEPSLLIADEPTHGARRDRAGVDHRASPRPQSRASRRGHPDHAQHGAGRESLQPRHGYVRGPHRRGGSDAVDFQEPTAPVHVVALALHAPGRRGRSRASHLDSRPAA